MTRNRRIALVACALSSGLLVAVIQVQALPGRRRVAAAQAESSRTPGGSGNISGVVRSSNGPEAGVWVIAETDALPTKFRKIVVTDDQGRYLIPDLPGVKYKVWVRGYGLVDSQPVESTPGNTLALTAVVAPSPKDAAKVYPADYWYSLMELPAKSEFPMTISDFPGSADQRPGGSAPRTMSQAEWVFNLKRGCGACHQLGDKATREIPSALGHFDSGFQGWGRRIMSGQEGQSMVGGVRRLGYDRGLRMFSDWTDRVAAGELPPAPPRPQGIERNVVISTWDFDSPKAFVHDMISTDKRNPMLNPYGPVFATEWSAGTVESVDPIENTRVTIKIPLSEAALKYKNEHPTTMLMPSPYWGEETVFDDTINTEAAQRDSKGRIWFGIVAHKATNPAFCKAGSSNPFAKNFPVEANPRDREYYDPKTGKFGTVDMCAGGQHLVLDTDKDETLYGTSGFGISWLKTRVWDETQDAEKSQGWCPAVIDYNGDGKTGPYTKANEPPDPKLDRMVAAGGYGIGINPVDHSVWYAAMAPSPGRIVRIAVGANPPATCMAEVYEPPFDNARAPGVQAYFPEGIDVDTNGVVWTAMSGTNELASFDRRKCKVLNGPTATGQQCPEGWTLYPVPGPKFKGSNIPSDFFYYNWVDQFNTFGMGKDAPAVTGTNSDSIILLDPVTKKFATLRVPYPLGFYTRYVDGRIDDPKAGWKGRGLWAANETRVNWHDEGGKGSTSYVVHFQLRPDPLAK